MKKPHRQSKDDKLLEIFITDMLVDDPSDRVLVKPYSKIKTETTSENTAKSVESRIPENSLNSDAHPDQSQQPKFIKPLMDADERLEKVQHLLSRIPLALKEVEPELDAQSPTETLSETVSSEISIEQQEAIEESIEAPLEPSIADKTKSVIELNVPQSLQDQARSLLSQDVSREVEKSRAFLNNAFQTLIFEVGKLPLAVPLIKLGGIHAYSDEDVTPIFGTPKWFKGLIPSEHGNIMLVDTARWVMPEKYQQVQSTLDYKYAILLDDTRWALACTRVRESKTIQVDDVRWAQKGSRNQWFAGMVVEYMCALLEVDAFINLLYEHRKQQK